MTHVFSGVEYTGTSGGVCVSCFLTAFTAVKRIIMTAVKMLRDFP